MPDQPPEHRGSPLFGVAAGLDLVVISDNEVLIQFGTRSRPSELLRDKDLTGVLGRVVGRLTMGPAPLEDLLRAVDGRLEADARTLLSDLIGRGVVADVRLGPIEQYLRYALQGESSPSNSRTCIIGSGPLGARIAENLLQQGFRLSLLDDRPVDATWRAFMPTNIAGQDEGRADVLLQRRFPGSANCVGGGLDFPGVEQAVIGADFVLLALEQPDLRVAHWVNRVAIRERKPWLLATIDGNLGLVGPLFLPVETACFNDYQTLSIAGTASPAMARKHREHALQRGATSFFTGLPAYAGMVASHASLAAVHFLLRGSCFALGRVMVIDFERMRIDVEDVMKLPRCPVCGSEKSAYRPAVPA